MEIADRPMISLRHGKRSACGDVVSIATGSIPEVGNVVGAPFDADRTYENVFLIFVDSAGHSSIVAANPRDRAARAFDLLHERVIGRLDAVARHRRCERADLWRWAGDGGFLAVHDSDESIARDVALEFARSLLELDLRHLRDEFRQMDIGGQLHLRIAVHRGTIRYRGIGLEGSVYSPDINFAAHLERAAPVDTVAISEDVYRVAGRFAELFELAGPYEGRQVYLFTGSQQPGAGARAWLAAHGLVGAGPVFGYAERPNQVEKARLVNAATTEVIDLGSAIRTGAHYLVTTERPAYMRDATLDFLRRGGRYRCIMMDPDSEATRQLSRLRREDVSSKIHESLTSLRRFKDRNGADADGLEVYQTRACLTLGCISIDLDEPHAMILISPYLTAQTPSGHQVELSEMPHYLVGRQAGQLFGSLRTLIRTFAEQDVTRVL